MDDLFTLHNLFTLGMLILLQAVLGFDNLLYISIESKRAPDENQRAVRQWGIGIAIVLRIVLLFVVIRVIGMFQEPFLTIPEGGPIGWALSGDITLHAVIVLLGGVFILYTAVKEIMHMMAIEDVAHGVGDNNRSSTWMVVSKIVAMNLVFSFDSILSAMALTDNFWVMATAIVISGAMMIWLAEHVSEFLKKNRLYEVLGLFILFIVGVMLIGEGGHLAHLHLFGYIVEPMAKSTFYFTIAILVVIDIVQGRYQKKLMAEKHREIVENDATTA
ncbi:Integral membrane protein TerC family protein [Pseudobythopirellula maris]|uniref:Integral membrane protein TerC family protein n=1 Tax=Pseudobythopirellula maris TaxID=2527991 RepID=A0A5C5ZPH2_9BACT|nr:TerC family protein [Pseudobythopirellula maris]TWT88283.1 Integral membrane protein TerC family protein [Pseudobythopirellula maris]